MTDLFTRWLQDDIGPVQTGKAESLLESRLITGRTWAGPYWSMKILSKAFWDSEQPTPAKKTHSLNLTGQTGTGRPKT